MSDMVPMTREKYNQLRAEVDQLENVDMPYVTEKIAEARAEGDLKENAEYHAQRENQGMLQAKINQKKQMIANAYIIDPSKQPKDQVALLATVDGQGFRLWRRRRVHFGRCGGRGLRCG